MALQYCQITSWIQHDKDHADPEFAEAIKDLCLDSFLKKARRNTGLTFLYPGDKKTRKEFCKKVFTAESRDAVESFKRYILPDVYETTEDFKTKDVGNILGYKYEVSSATASHVKFANGMEIKPIKSYVSLNPALENLVKIYIITHGAPPESGDPYKVPIPHKTKGGTWKDFQSILPPILKLLENYVDVSDQRGLTCVYSAYSIGLEILDKSYQEVLKLEIPNNSDIEPVMGGFDLTDFFNSVKNNLEEKEKLLLTIKDLILVQAITHCNKYGIIEYIRYLLITVWEENSTKLSETVKILCYKVLEKIIKSLINSEESISLESYLVKFTDIAAKVSDFEKVKITEQISTKFQKLHEQLQKDLKSNALMSVVTVINAFLDRAATTGELFKVQLFPIIPGKEELHKDLILNMLVLICKTQDSPEVTTKEIFDIVLKSLKTEIEIETDDKLWKYKILQWSTDIIEAHAMLQLTMVQHQNNQDNLVDKIFTVEKESDSPIPTISESFFDESALDDSVNEAKTEILLG